MTGIELIAKERQEQKEKHGYSEEHDSDHDCRELVLAALFALTMKEEFKQNGFEKYEEKVKRKDFIGRLIVAGALIAAEIDIILAEPKI